ncbi:MAG: hypothetical protein KKH98_00490, partial [Spirochaetes bacterium]|nr:hypothetical protein [Spirochaetota bacterium]
INRSNINGINVSLDSLDRDVYRKITGHGDLDTVKKNLEHVQIKKIKINTVLLKGINDHEVEDIINYTVSRNFIPRFIECMETKPSNKDLFISNSLIIRQLINKRILMKDSRRGIPGSAAEYYSLRGSDNKTVGFISPVSNRFCKSCNRLRLTSNGYLYLCLFNQKPENISELLKGASTDEEVSDRFKALLLKKAPERMNNPVDMRSMGG